MKSTQNYTLNTGIFKTKIFGGGAKFFGGVGGKIIW